MSNTEQNFSVTQVVDSLQAGGAERVAVDTANELAKLGHRSYLCATRSSGSLRNALSTEVLFHCLERASTLDWKGIVRFRSFIRNNAIQIIHAHGNSTAMFCVVALAGMSVRIVHHDHNPIIENRKAWLEKILLRRVDAWICVSAPILRWAQETVHFEKAFFLQNPVDTHRFKPMTSADKIRMGTKKLVVVANYKEHKDYFNLLHAVHQQESVLKHYQINCYGGHTQSAYFHALVQEKERLHLDNVSLFPSTENIPEILSSSQIGILSSSSEGLPISLLEYMAAGLPVVVTEVGECGAIVRAARNGYVVPAKNSELLGRAIVQIIDRGVSFEEMRNNGISYVQEYYSATRFIKRINEEYQRFYNEH